MLALKVVLVPMIILGASCVGKWFGPRAAGRVSSLPILAGPVLWIVASTHGAAYGARAAAVTLAGVSGCAAYGVVYYFASRRAAWPWALTASLAAWLALCAALGLPDWSLLQRVAFTILTLTAARFLLATSHHPVVPRDPQLSLLGRALSGGLLALVVDVLAKRSAPQWAGLVSAFPMLSVVLSVSSHRTERESHLAELLRAMVFGFPSFAAFCLIVAACLPTLGLGTTFVLASIAALAVRITLDCFDRPQARAERPPYGHLGQETPHGD